MNVVRNRCQQQSFHCKRLTTHLCTKLHASRSDVPPRLATRLMSCSSDYNLVKQSHQQTSPLRPTPLKPRLDMRHSLGKSQHRSNAVSGLQRPELVMRLGCARPQLQLVQTRQHVAHPCGIL